MMNWSWLKRLVNGSIEKRPRSKEVQLVVQRYDQAAIAEFTPLLCNGYKLSGSFTLADIEDFVRRTVAEAPQIRLLATLDDAGQAFYTSGHTIDIHELDEVAGHDLSGLPPAAFENGEHLGHLTLTEEFFIRQANFAAKAALAKLPDIQGKRLWSDGPDRLPSVMNSSTAVGWGRIDRCYVQEAPVDRASAALAAFPNGYFFDDYSPFENFVLARELEERFGFELFGVGATYLGFLGADPLEGRRLDDLAIFLASLFKPGEPGEIATRITRSLAGERTFYFAYGDR